MIKVHEAGLPTADLCRTHGLGPARFCKLAAKPGGMDLSETKRPTQLKDKKAKLKCLRAEITLHNVVSWDLPGSPDSPIQWRDAVPRALEGRPICQRRACLLLGVDAKTVRRAHPADNPEIRLEMNNRAGKRRQFG